MYSQQNNLVLLAFVLAVTSCFSSVVPNHDQKIYGDMGTLTIDTGGPVACSH